MKKTFIAGLSAAFFLSGCALTSETIEISYKPTASTFPIPGAETVTIYVQVIDSRTDRSKVSAKKNGFGMEMAPILSRQDVKEIIQGAIESELLQRGFKLENFGRAMVVIDAELVRFYSDFKTGFFAGDAIADLNMTVLVGVVGGQQKFTKVIRAQGKEENIQLASGENAQLALNKALANGIRDLFGDPKFIETLTQPAVQK